VILICDKSLHRLQGHAYGAPGLTTQPGCAVILADHDRRGHASGPALTGQGGRGNADTRDGGLRRFLCACGTRRGAPPRGRGPALAVIAGRRNAPG